MSEDTGEQILRDLAMDNALTLYKGQAVSAEELLKTAEMIRLYRDGQVSVQLPNIAPSLDHSDRLGDVVSEKARSLNGHSQMRDGHGNNVPANGFSCRDSRINDTSVMPEVCDIIDENSGRVVGFQALNPSSYRLQKRVGAFTHTNSSSVGVDNSASEVATPARTKIIIPWQRLECMEGTGDGIVIVLKGAVA